MCAQDFVRVIYIHRREYFHINVREELRWREKIQGTKNKLKCISSHFKIVCYPCLITDLMLSECLKAQGKPVTTHGWKAVCVYSQVKILHRIIISEHKSLCTFQDCLLFFKIYMAVHFWRGEGENQSFLCGSREAHVTKERFMNHLCDGLCW